MNLRRCPICHVKVSPTIHGNIAGHLDKAQKPCVASGESYEIALRVGR